MQYSGCCLVHYVFIVRWRSLFEYSGCCLVPYVFIIWDTLTILLNMKVCDQVVILSVGRCWRKTSPDIEGCLWTYVKDSFCTYTSHNRQTKIKGPMVIKERKQIVKFMSWRMRNRLTWRVFGYFNKPFGLVSCERTNDDKREETNMIIIDTCISISWISICKCILITTSLRLVIYVSRKLSKCCIFWNFRGDTLNDEWLVISYK